MGFLLLYFIQSYDLFCLLISWLNKLKILTDRVLTVLYHYLLRWIGLLCCFGLWLECLFTSLSNMETKTKSLENVWCEATCRVSCYGKTKWDRKVRPTRCVTVLDGISDLKDHYRLKGQTYLWKGDIVDLKLKMWRCDWYWYRVVDWQYA